MAKLFGTDGVRGEANIFLTPELAFTLGKAAAEVLKKNMKFTAAEKKPVILIGKDTRVSGDMLEAALASGICSMGIDVDLLGVCPTPTVAYITRKENYIAGVMISASHNPAADNGIKFFNSEGFKLPDLIEENIENIVNQRTDAFLRPAGDKVGKITHVEDKINQYKNFLLDLFPLDLSGKTIVVDCANGSASYLMPEILNKFGCTVIPIYNHPDGLNINDDCGSTHLESLASEVRVQGADLGIAHDGDSDRVLLVNRLGEEIDGDMIMAVIAEDLKEQGKLTNNIIVGTVMSNLGLKKYLQDRDITFLAAKVGDRYVLEEMLAHGAVVGGEQSGHLIFLECNTTGDGILTALMVLEIMSRKQKSIEQLLEKYVKFPQILENVKVSTKIGWDQHPQIKDIIAKKEKELGDQGRVLVRPSGTENLIRVMVEGADQRNITMMAKEIGRVIAGVLS